MIYNLDCCAKQTSIRCFYIWRIITACTRREYMVQDSPSIWWSISVSNHTSRLLAGQPNLARKRRAPGFLVPSKFGCLVCCWCTLHRGSKEDPQGKMASWWMPRWDGCSCCTEALFEALFSSSAKKFCVGILLIWNTKWSLFTKLFAQMGCKSRDESNDAN